MVEITAGRMTNAAWAHAVDDREHGDDGPDVGHRDGDDQTDAEQGDEQTDERHGGRRAPAEQRVGSTTGDGDRDERGDGDERGHDAPLEGVQSEVVVEVEAQEERRAEQGESERGHADEEVVEALDLSKSLEGDRQRDRQLVLYFGELLAENRLHLVATPPGFLDGVGRQRDRAVPAAPTGRRAAANRCRPRPAPRPTRPGTGRSSCRPPESRRAPRTPGLGPGSGRRR